MSQTVMFQPLEQTLLAYLPVNDAGAKAEAEAQRVARMAVLVNMVGCITARLRYWNNQAVKTIIQAIVLRILAFLDQPTCSFVCLVHAVEGKDRTACWQINF